MTHISFKIHYKTIVNKRAFAKKMYTQINVENKVQKQSHTGLTTDF